MNHFVLRLAGGLFGFGSFLILVLGVIRARSGDWSLISLWVGYVSVAALLFHRMYKNLYGAHQYPDCLWNIHWRWSRIKTRVRSSWSARRRGFKLATVQHMEPIPPGSNPFHYDSMNMGTDLVRGWTVMHPGFDRPEEPLDLPYLILINCRTGQRLRVVLN